MGDHKRGAPGAKPMTKADMAHAVAVLLNPALMRLHRETGIPVECILAGAHAKIVAMIAGTFGADVAADACDRAAARLRDMQSPEAAALAAAVPMEWA